MSITRIIDSPVTWVIAGVALGFGLEVTTASAWLLALALGGYLANLNRHRHEDSTEGRLVATGPGFMMGWLAGFIIRGLAF